MGKGEDFIGEVVVVWYRWRMAGGEPHWEEGMSGREDSLEWMKVAAVVAARGLAAAGRFVGEKVAAAYRGVDPDVHRHVAQLPLMSYSLFTRKARPVEAGEPDGHPPLVFVHGLGGGRGDFVPMAWYLRFMGRRRSYSIRFEGTGDVESRGGQVAAFIREVVAVTGEPRVDVVAHSLGGVAAQVAILDHDLGRRVRRLVTLGSPHGGTYAARLGNTPVTRDLRPDSALMERLRRTPLPRSVEAVSFWSGSDLVIMPPESAALPGSRQVEMTPFTHYGYLIHPRSWRAVFSALSHG